MLNLFVDFDLELLDLSPSLLLHLLPEVRIIVIIQVRVLPIAHGTTSSHQSWQLLVIATSGSDWRRRYFAACRVKVIFNYGGCPV